MSEFREIVRKTGMSASELANFFGIRLHVAQKWISNPEVMPESVSTIVPNTIKKEILYRAIFKFEEDFDGKVGISFTKTVEQDNGVFTPQFQWFKTLTVKNLRFVFLEMKKHQKMGYNVIIL